MNKAVRVLAVLVLVCFAVLATGCAGETDPTEAEEGKNAEQAPVIYMTLLKGMGNMEDWPLVLEEINKIIMDKIQVQVDVSYIDASNAASQINARILRKEPLDLVIFPDFRESCRKGYVMELDGLLDAYGADIKNILSEEELGYGKSGEHIYGLCRNAELATSYGICMRKDILEEYEIDPENIRSLDDVEKMLEEIHAAGGRKEKIAPMIFPVFDPLGDGNGVLMEEEQPLQVVNYYDSEEFEAFVRRIYNWKQKGYIFEKGYSYDNSRDLLYSAFADGELFAYFIKYKPGIDVQEKNLTGVDVVTVNLTEPVIVTEASAMGMWSIYSESQHPEEAMKLLNLLYTDKELMNLFCWGIEGKHYVVKEDGTITYPENVTAKTVGYNYNRNWQFPNQYLAYTWEDDSKTLEEDVKQYNAAAVRSPAVGFAFDDTYVQAECERVNEVVDVYMRGFLTGEFELKEALASFREELQRAGMDRIVEEKQRQLNQWLEEQ